MPDYKVYIPEAKAPLLYQYKEQFGKDASNMIVGFMENALINTNATINQSSTNQGVPSIDHIYQTYFGDIENEHAFLYIFENRESARLALKNRAEILYKKHPDIYLDVIAQFKEQHPNLAKIQGT